MTQVALASGALAGLLWVGRSWRSVGGSGSIGVVDVGPNVASFGVFVAGTAAIASIAARLG